MVPFHIFCSLTHYLLLIHCIGASEAYWTRYCFQQHHRPLQGKRNWNWRECLWSLYPRITLSYLRGKQGVYLLQSCQPTWLVLRGQAAPLLHWPSSCTLLWYQNVGKRRRMQLMYSRALLPIRTSMHNGWCQLWLWIVVGWCGEWCRCTEWWWVRVGVDFYKKVCQERDWGGDTWMVK